MRCSEAGFYLLSAFVRGPKVSAITAFLSRILRRRLCVVATVLLCTGSGAGVARASSPPSRPILFVHGFCGSDQDFAALLGPLYAQLSSSLYPSSAIYFVRYDARTNLTAFFASSGAAVEESAIPSNTRFFSIQLYDPVGDSANSTGVSNISVLNKAYEISEAIQHITAITHIKDVIVVAHSMGGLDARAYIENMASVGACYDYQGNGPNYAANTCQPGAGEAAYGGDVGDLVTIDSPHAGTPLDTFPLGPFVQSIGTCLADESVNRAEMNPQNQGGPGLLEALNYDGSPLADATPAKNTAPIEAVEDFFSDVPDAWDDLTGDFSGLSDDIVLETSQSIAKNLPAAHSSAKLSDVTVGYASNNAAIARINAHTEGCEVIVPWKGSANVSLPMLHFMSCLGALEPTQNAIAQQVAAYTAGSLTKITVSATQSGKVFKGTLNFKLTGPGESIKGASVPATMTDLALGTYALTYLSGGPVGAGAPKITASPSATLKRGQWAAAFTLAFGASKPPAAVTGSAASITKDGAAVKGTVNPEGMAGTAFLEWSTNAKLNAPKIACTAGLLKNCPAVVPNGATQTFSAKIATAPANTKIYYRMAFYETAKKTTLYGAIDSFTTLK